MSREVIYAGNVAGVTFSPAKEGLQALIRHAETSVGKEIVTTLTHNPANPHDHEALEVRVNSFMVGHVPRPYNSKIIREGLDRVEVSFDRFNMLPDRSKIVGLQIEVLRKQS